MNARAPLSRVLARLASLAQIGELARRLNTRESREPRQKWKEHNYYTVFCWLDHHALTYKSHGNTIIILFSVWMVDNQKYVKDLLPASLWSVEVGSTKGHTGQHCPFIYIGSLHSGCRHTVARHSCVPLRQTQTVQSFGSQVSPSP